ncbi:hypothetical protein DV515_00006702 [Chloebia gouldiae]|uniref:Uncharacterized protein n=1 Tax=Chloebia gouldiae TaxID=44316 RepID=A0A3L8SJ59_CHLGU|nr:hypothetical protein DV515_00006702 [Chloebia gouldiae]
MTFQAQFLTFVSASKSTSNTSKHHFEQFSLRQERRVTRGSRLAAPGCGGYLQSMVRHSLLSLHEAPMGLRATPLQKGVIRRCRGLGGWGWPGARDTPWVCNTAGGPSALILSREDATEM